MMLMSASFLLCDQTWPACVVTVLGADELFSYNNWHINGQYTLYNELCAWSVYECLVWLSPTNTHWLWLPRGKFASLVGLPSINTVEYHRTSFYGHLPCP